MADRVTGGRIGIAPTLRVAESSTGGMTGKMISAQSIAVALMGRGGTCHLLG